MTDDELVALLNDHRRAGAAAGRQYLDRGQVIDEIGERAIGAVDAWVESQGGETRMLAVGEEVYDLPAELLGGADAEAPASADEPRNSL